MSQGKRTPFRGSQLLIQTADGTPVAITGITAANPPVLTVANTAVPGDVITISEVSAEIDGQYLVQSATSSAITLGGGADFTGLTTTVTASSMMTPATFTRACEITAFSRTGGTIDQIEVSDACSDRKEYESGLPDSGTIQLTFNYAPATAVQLALAAYEDSGDKFWTKLVLPREQGTLAFYGAIQTGMNIDGAVNGVYTSGVTIQLSGNSYRIPYVAP